MDELQGYRQTNGLKKVLRIAQAAFFPPLFLGCHGALCWRGCQAYIKALNRYVSAQAGRELEIWLQAVPAHPQHCRRQPASLPCCLGCLRSSQAAPTSWGGGELSGMLLKRLGCQVRSDCGLFFFFFFRVGGYLIALNSEIIIQALSRRRCRARKKKKNPCQRKRLTA